MWLAKRISRHFLNQSEVKPKPSVTYSHAFSRAWRRLHVFASSFDSFIGLPVSAVIGQSNYFGVTFLVVLTQWDPQMNNNALFSTHQRLGIVGVEASKEATFVRKQLLA